MLEFWSFLDSQYKVKWNKQPTPYLGIMFWNHPSIHCHITTALHREQAGRVRHEQLINRQINFPIKDNPGHGFWRIHTSCSWLTMSQPGWVSAVARAHHKTWNPVCCLTDFFIQRCLNHQPLDKGQAYPPIPALHLEARHPVQLTGQDTCSVLRLQFFPVLNNSLISHGLYRENGWWVCVLDFSTAESGCLVHHQGAIANATSERTKSRSKHIDLRHHYVRELFESGKAAIKQVLTDEMLVDHLTKLLSTQGLCHSLTINNTSLGAWRWGYIETTWFHNMWKIHPFKFCVSSSHLFPWMSHVTLVSMSHHSKPMYWWWSLIYLNSGSLQ